jgi:hypothetical protein
LDGELYVKSSICQHADIFEFRFVVNFNNSGVFFISDNYIVAWLTNSHATRQCDTYGVGLSTPHACMTNTGGVARTYMPHVPNISDATSVVCQIHTTKGSFSHH